MSHKTKAILIVSLVTVLLVMPLAAAAQEATPPDGSSNLTLITEFPALVLGIEESVNVPIKIRANDMAEIVSLDVEGLDDNWTTAFRGRGRVIRAVYVEPGEEVSVELRVEPSAAVEAGMYAIEVLAIGANETARFPIELYVGERAPASLTLEADLPTLRGKSSSTFRYSASLQNDGDEDLAVQLLTEASSLFDVSIKSGSQEVTGLPLEAGSSKKLSIEARPLLGTVPSGSYLITVQAIAGEVSATLELTAEVTGEASISLTTTDGRLSGDAEAGSETTYNLIITNNGSAAAQGIELRSSQPSGWEVSLEPAIIEVLEPDEQVEAVATVRPAEKALAGDYMLTFRAQPENDASQAIDFRVTVRTSTLWGVAGIALIAVSVMVVGWAVMRFGRR